MGDQTPPLDPTGAELMGARRNLARVDDNDVIHHAFAQLAGRLDVIAAPGVDAERTIREMRAVVAAYDERQAAARRKAVGS